MSPTFAAGPHTEALWQAAAGIVHAIDALPFLRELACGTLSPHAFAHYLGEDRRYLAGYAKALALLAARAGERTDARFWAECSAHALAAEEATHARLLAHPALAHAGTAADTLPAPTSLGYLSWTIAQAATAPYAIGVASVLPCFWIYAHVGRNLLAAARDLAGDHPYRQWIATYEDPAFAAATRAAVAVLERQCTGADAASLAAIHASFVQGCRWELRFWADAHAMQGWAGGQAVR